MIGDRGDRSPRASVDGASDRRELGGEKHEHVQDGDAADVGVNDLAEADSGPNREGSCPWGPASRISWAEPREDPDRDSLAEGVADEAE